MMPDRPAAELLAEFDGPFATGEEHHHALVRLARAEQTIADQTQQLANAWDDGWNEGHDTQPGGIVVVSNPHRAALRASQGGQT